MSAGMEYRVLGRTGLKVSVLSFGTMTFGGVGDWFAGVGRTDVQEARTLVSLALDAGVNLFDTADVYSGGASEEILGQALGARRDDVLIATKAHYRMGEDPNAVGQSRHHLVRAVEASLRRLGTDHIDLFQVHAFDGLTALDETLAALDDLVSAGKVRYAGCSNYSAWQLMKALGISDARGLTRYCSLQAYYNLVARELEHEFLPLCLDQGVGVIVWSPLAGGFLSGKFRRGGELPVNTRGADVGFFPGLDLEQGYDIVETMAGIAEVHDVTPAVVALGWVLRRRGVSSVIIGARTREQLEINLRAASLELTQDELDTLDRVSERPLPYPYWHQQATNVERLAGPSH